MTRTYLIILEARGGRLLFDIARIERRRGGSFEVLLVLGNVVVPQRYDCLQRVWCVLCSHMEGCLKLAHKRRRIDTPIDEFELEEVLSGLIVIMCCVDE